MVIGKALVKRRYLYNLGNGTYSTIDKNTLKKKIKGIDLLIIDADGTIAPHLTVGLANEITSHHVISMFSRNIYEHEKRILNTRQTIKKITEFLSDKESFISLRLSHYRTLLRLGLSGSLLYIMKWLHDFRNIIQPGKVDNHYIIALFQSIIRNHEVQLKNFLFTQKEIEKSMYPKVKDFIAKFKSKKVMISQSFSYNSSEKLGKGLIEQYKPILKLDKVISNRFILDHKGDLIETDVIIKCARHKKEQASKIIKKYKAKHVAVIVNDYEDIGLARLPEAEIVILNNPPLRLLKYGTVVLNNDYSVLSKL